jgi:hypothetical protein
VFGGQDREFITVKNAVALLLLAVWPFQKLFDVVAAIVSVFVGRIF